MTSKDLSRSQAPDAEAEADEPRYAVEPSLIEARGQSVAMVLGDRLCEAARAKLKSPDAWRSMTYKEIRKLMKDNCSGQEGYLEPQQPILDPRDRCTRVALRSRRQPIPRRDSRRAVRSLGHGAVAAAHLVRGASACAGQRNALRHRTDVDSGNV